MTCLLAKREPGSWTAGLFVTGLNHGPLSFQEFGLELRCSFQGRKFGTENWPASGCTRNECRGPPSRSHTAVAATEARPVQGLQVIMADRSKQQVSRIYPELLRGCVWVRVGGPVTQRGSARVQSYSLGRVGG